MCFVGFNQQPLSKEKLLELLDKHSTLPSYYFLRWKHRVGGFWERRNEKFGNIEDDIRERLKNNLPKNSLQNNPTPEPTETFPSPEGQLFNSILEIRWKRQKGEYQVLVLSSKDTEADFTPIQRNWEILEQNALTHSPTETRFPKGLNTEQLNIAQRYFRDSHTATVHFVALTVKN
ncbi:MULTISPECIES: hypothetical protein [Nostocales]|uniref:Uncharacterized protein n=3 Tax=Nostocales TaxID=1161 RepID=A0A0C1MYK3_9CYAN|nr:hypothetical protein [Tolypothrix bouteillei]KAF3889085.1 hypothetical protein DA73_0400029100 [Tolypothrix bouteillei VB521301]